MKRALEPYTNNLSDEVYYTHEANGNINVLPEEIFEHIFSYLAGKNLHSVSMVNFFWEDRALKVLKHHMLEIKNFSNYMIQNLQSTSFDEKTLMNQNKEIDNLFEKKTLRFSEVNNLTTQVRAGVLQSLHKLNLEDLDQMIELESSSFESRSNFSEHVLNLAKVYYEINARYLTSDIPRKMKASKIIVHGLAKAFASKHTIPITPKYPSIEPALKSLISKGEFKKALENCLQKIEIKERNPLIHEIFDILISLSDLENAIYFANWILNVDDRNSFLERLSSEFTKRGQMHRALNVASMIPSEDIQAAAIKKIFSSTQALF